MLGENDLGEDFQDIDEEAEDDDDMVSLKRNSSFLRDRKKQF